MTPFLSTPCCILVFRNGCIHSYSSVPYCDTVAFHYGGGAFGSEMIPEEDKKSFMCHHNIQEIGAP